jgi:Ca2+-transporting ATPase
LVGSVLELRSERTLEQLDRLTRPTATTWRDGEARTIATVDLVPGDLIELKEGDIVPADGELLSGAQIVVDESALTGESAPAVKDAAAMDAEDRQVYGGTTILSGRGVARIAVTGARTRYGRIGTLVAGIREPATPLERLIRQLVRRIALVAVACCVAVAALELARGNGWAAALIAGVSLAIAAIPEEFPMVYTLYLTLGARRLARDRALVRRLPGVETLGSTTVVCTDKTGTLTVGHLEVAAVRADGEPASGARGLTPASRAVLEAAVLASEPSPFDPLEQAIVRYAATNGIDVEALQAMTLVRDYPFDPARKYMSHLWQGEQGQAIYAKGAVEGILDLTGAGDALREQTLRTNRELASDGMRVIGIAAGRTGDSGGNRRSDESALGFLGLIGFSDPLRPGVAEALEECQNAGIRVVMVTGDHPVTAHAVAEGLSLPHKGERIATGDEIDADDDEALKGLVTDVDIFARVRPEQKHRLVRALRAGGEVVAMTGDGINDAPALREADIGVAMGERGTEVARAAATMVLLDDNFATIVGAVRDGRRIVENLRRAFAYLIAFHAPILLAALIVPLLDAPLLLLPVHLVVLEIILHPVVALVFENEPASPGLMQQPPRRPGTALVTLRTIVRPLATGLTLFAGVLALFLARLAQGAPEPEARALALTTLILGQTLLVLVERSPDRPLWRATWAGNRALPYIIGAVLITLPAMLYLPPLAALLKLAPLFAGDWAIAGAVALGTTAWAELGKSGRQTETDR